tara:strand:- start:122 stop:403 length:282 start_codon:yes stop_codon:yes gene_type:complete
LNKTRILIGIFTGLLATASSVIFLTLILSSSPVEDSWTSLYDQGKLGGLLSLGAISNLIIFFLSIRKNKISFATGIVIACLVIVLLIFLIKFF